MSASDPSAPGLPLAGGGGATLPTTPAAALLDASNAGEVVTLAAGTGAGTSTAVDVVVQDGLTQLLGGDPEGTVVMADGVGGIALSSAAAAALLAATTAAGQRTAIGAAATVTTTRGDLIRRGASADERVALGAAGTVLSSNGTDPVWSAPYGPTTYYADDFTAEAGSESASVTGTDSASTFTLGATSTARVYGTSGATAARVVLPIPAGAREIEVEIQLTSVSGMSTGGWRYLTIALRNAADGGAPTVLWGISLNDSGGGFYANNLMGGGNGGSPSGPTTHAPTSADKWFRVVLKPRESFLTFTTGAGSGGARPTTWSAPSTAVPLQVNANSVTYPDMGSATAIAIVLQSFGSGGASSVTGKATVRVVPQ